jgi:uncharacterized protein (TIGR02453 family)
MPASSREREGLGPETLPFLRELARNNNRPWFQKNKERYETDVQAPALHFIDAMGPGLARLSRYVTADARPFGGSLSRIYRDTRFSKDKSPYKTAIGIHFAHAQATREERLPGFFLHVAPGESVVYSGVWHPSPPAQTRIRNAIVASPAGWGKVLGKVGTIEGESYARVPVGYPADHRYADDLRRKDFFSGHPFSDAEVSATGFGATFERACRDLNPLNAFLATAIGVPW